MQFCVCAVLTVTQFAEILLAVGCYRNRWSAESVVRRHHIIHLHTSINSSAITATCFGMAAAWIRYGVRLITAEWCNKLRWDRRWFDSSARELCGVMWVAILIVLLVVVDFEIRWISSACHAVGFHYLAIRSLHKSIFSPHRKPSICNTYPTIIYRVTDSNRTSMTESFGLSFDYVDELPLISIVRAIWKIR